MKSKKFALLALSASLLYGCTASDNTGVSEENDSFSVSEKEVSAETTEPLDLSGSWQQEDADEETYMAGYIQGKTMEIYWIMDNGETKMLYWAGTYVPPEEDLQEYTWVSENDTLKTDMALLASSSEAKEFTYKDGKITFTVSMQDVSRDVALVKTDKDYSEGFKETSVVEESQRKKAELEESGYTVLRNGDYVHISYAVRINNPNEELAIDFPTITITARREDNSIISSEEMVLMNIAAGETITYANDAMYEGNEDPATVDITVSNGKDDYSYQNGSGAVYEKDLAISNVSVRKDSFSTAFTGEITNNSDMDTDLAITVLYKDDEGNMLGGFTGYLDDVASKETKVFEITDYSETVKDYSTYELYAHNW